MVVGLQIEPRPWATPNYVVIVVGGEEVSVALADVDHDTIRGLVQKWTEAVYAKAGIE